MASFTSIRPKGTQAQFEGPTITGGPQSSAGQAAGTVNLGNTFGSLRKNGPRFDELAATAIANRAQERATVTQVEGQVAAQGVQAYGATKSAQIQAEAAKEAAQAQAKGCLLYTSPSPRD